jgi:bifunctional DNA-binding transcriptional regulator/antitoxin component of YhaV-PrlF toxin-antitoxin module
MVTKITTKNMVSIPQIIAKMYGLRPGWKLDWNKGPGEDELLVRIIPDRAEQARRLMGKGARYAPQRDSQAELVSERSLDD